MGNIQVPAWIAQMWPNNCAWELRQFIQQQPPGTTITFSPNTKYLIQGSLNFTATSTHPAFPLPGSSAWAAINPGSQVFPLVDALMTGYKWDSRWGGAPGTTGGSGAKETGTNPAAGVFGPTLSAWDRGLAFDSSLAGGNPIVGITIDGGYDPIAGTDSGVRFYQFDTPNHTTAKAQIIGSCPTAGHGGAPYSGICANGEPICTYFLDNMRTGKPGGWFYPRNFLAFGEGCHDVEVRNMRVESARPTGPNDHWAVDLSDYQEGQYLVYISGSTYNLHVHNNYMRGAGADFVNWAGTNPAANIEFDHNWFVGCGRQAHTLVAGGKGGLRVHDSVFSDIRHWGCDFSIGNTGVAVTNIQFDHNVWRRDPISGVNDNPAWMFGQGGIGNGCAAAPGVGNFFGHMCYDGPGQSRGVELSNLTFDHETICAKPNLPLFGNNGSGGGVFPLRRNWKITNCTVPPNVVYLDMPGQTYGGSAPALNSNVTCAGWPGVNAPGPIWGPQYISGLTIQNNDIWCPSYQTNPTYPAVTFDNCENVVCSGNTFRGLNGVQFVQNYPGETWPSNLNQASNCDSNNQITPVYP